MISQPPSVVVPPAPPAPPPAAKRKTLTRLPFLDFTRGLAATVMLQGHVFHSFLRNDLRESGAYIISQFIGGLAPAVFLFLTGTTLGFMMYGFDRKHMTRWERVRGRAETVGLPVPARFPLPFSVMAFRAALQPVGRPVQGGHTQLHGPGDRRGGAAGSAYDCAAGTCRRHRGPDHRLPVAADSAE